MESVKTITEAQYTLRLRCLQFGYLQRVQLGEFENSNTHRVQLLPHQGNITIVDPLNFIDLPKHMTLKMIKDYHTELMNPVNESPADYTYGERIMLQLPQVLEMMRATPLTNQAAIEIAQPSDISMRHKPCLRGFQFIYDGNALHMFVYMRSNDIAEAFLLNHCGFAMILKDVAEYAELKTGRYHYSCPAAHLYSHSIPNLSKTRNGESQ